MYSQMLESHAGLEELTRVMENRLKEVFKDFKFTTIDELKALPPEGELEGKGNHLILLKPGKL